MTSKHVPKPMPYTKAGHLLNPLRSLVLSPKKLVSRLNLHRDSIVLELGPGPGYFSPEVARFIPEGRLILVDIQQEMLDMAQERLYKRGIINAEYRQGDAVSLPLESQTVDVAVLIAMLGEVPDRDACLKDIHRVLKNNGLLSITEIRLGDPDFIPKNDMKKIVQSTGFNLLAQYDGFLHYTVNFTK